MKSLITTLASIATLACAIEHHSIDGYAGIDDLSGGYGDHGGYLDHDGLYEVYPDHGGIHEGYPDHGGIHEVYPDHGGIYQDYADEYDIGHGDLGLVHSHNRDVHGLGLSLAPKHRR